MSEKKNPLVSSIPVILPLLVIGGTLGYLLESGLVDASIIKAAVYALVFGIGGALLGLQLQNAKRVKESHDNSDSVKANLAKEVSDAVSSTFSEFSEAIKGTEKTLNKLTSEISSSLGGHTSSLDNTVSTLASQLSDTYGGAAEEIKAALSEHAKLLEGAGGNWSEEIMNCFREHAEMIQSGVEALSAAENEWRSGLDSALNAHTDRLSAAEAKSNADLEGSLTGHTDRLIAAEAKWQSDLEGSLTGHTDRLAAAETKWQTNLEGVLTGHTDRVAAATEALSANLSAISDVSKNIEKMLHIQEAIDGALDTMNKSDEFQSTIRRLTKHLEDSDELLKRASKPRQIQLVESRVDK